MTTDVSAPEPITIGAQPERPSLIVKTDGVFSTLVRHTDLTPVEDVAFFEICFDPLKDTTVVVHKSLDGRAYTLREEYPLARVEWESQWGPVRPR